jgi:hypothetical protein
VGFLNIFDNTIDAFTDLLASERVLIDLTERVFRDYSESLIAEALEITALYLT